MGLEGQGLGLGKTEDGKGVAILLDGMLPGSCRLPDSDLDSYLDSYLDCG